MLLLSLLLLCILTMMVKPVFSFANLLVRDCEVELKQNVEIMGSPVTYSNEREIQLFPIGVHDESQVVRNGSHLLPQRQYKVILSPVTNQCMFEVTGGARFDKGNTCRDSTSRSLCGVLVVRFSPSILILLSARFVSAQGGVKVFKRAFLRQTLYCIARSLLPQSYKIFSSIVYISLQTQLIHKSLYCCASFS